MKEMNLCKVSVIVPIYNVEKYIERCVRSLMEQTIQESIEFVFVNDCSSDASMDVLQRVIADYPERKKNIKILYNEKNSGSALTRKNGLLASMGEYIIHCDSDDWVELDIYEKLLRKALEGNYDIVGCDYFDENVGHTVVNKQIFPQNSKECVRKMLRGELYCGVWNKLVRRELYDCVESFPVGINMWEDVVTIIPMTSQARRIGYVSEPLYHYAHYNPSSYVSQISIQSLQNMMDTITRIEQFFSDNQFGEIFFDDLRFMKLTVKLNLLIKSDGELQCKWNNLYSEANVCIWQYHKISIFWRLGLQLAAWRMLPLFNLMKLVARELR